MKTNGGSRACQCVLCQWPHHDVVIRRRKQPPVRRHPKELQRHLSIYQTSGRKYVQQSQLSCQHAEDRLVRAYGDRENRYDDFRALDWAQPQPRGSGFGSACSKG